MNLGLTYQQQEQCCWMNLLFLSFRHFSKACMNVYGIVICFLVIYFAAASRRRDQLTSYNPTNQNTEHARNQTKFAMLLLTRASSAFYLFENEVGNPLEKADGISRSDAHKQDYCILEIFTRAGFTAWTTTHTAWESLHACISSRNPVLRQSRRMFYSTISVCNKTGAIPWYTSYIHQLARHWDWPISSTIWNPSTFLTQSSRNKMNLELNVTRKKEWEEGYSGQWNSMEALLVSQLGRKRCLSVNPETWKWFANLTNNVFIT